MATTEEEKKKYGYQSQYQDQIDDLYGKIKDRKDFSYDVNSDAMYQQLKDQYVQGGKMAMMDAMGQAQSMTGGYGNSYAQSVGQQTYQNYLQGLNEQVPDLYQMSLNRYIQQGDQLTDQYSMLTAQEAQDYSRWQDQQSLALQQVQALIDKGVRPSDELLGQTGLSQEYMDAMLPNEPVSSGGSYRNAVPGKEGLEPDSGADDFETVAAFARQAKNSGYSTEQIVALVNSSTLSASQKANIIRSISNAAGGSSLSAIAAHAY